MAGNWSFIVPVMEGGKYYIGTSGWSYKHWKGLFYPLELPATDWLEFYAEKFHITEINTSFYHLPRIKTVENWVQNTPEDFLFCPKMSRYVTHIKRLLQPEDPLEKFFTAMAPMKDRMGPVLIQLPPSSRFDHQRAEYFYSVLRSGYGQYDFVMEVRHTSWFDEESLNLMTKYNIGLVISQSNGKFPYKEAVTSENVYLRFHGPGDLYASSYPDDQLEYYAHFILKYRNEGHNVWAFFNNDIHGFALHDAERLRNLCDAM